MRRSKTSKGEIEVEINESVVIVTYEYCYDAGVWTYSNGDPGYPSSLDIDILSAVDTETNIDIADDLTSKQISIIEEEIQKQEDNDDDHEYYPEYERDCDE